MSLTEQSLAWGGVHYSAHALWKRDGQSVNGRQECLTHYAPISLDDVPWASSPSRRRQATACRRKWWQPTAPSVLFPRHLSDRSRHWLYDYFIQ
jgi:hypothetical protein